VSSVNVITNVPNRKVNRVIFMLAGCDRNSCLVAPKYDGDEHCSMGVWVEGNNVLFIEELVRTSALSKEIYIHIASRPSPQT
jgi:hypothetical protein